MERLEFELGYYDVAVQYISHDTTGSPPSPFSFDDREYFMKIPTSSVHDLVFYWDIYKAH